jgi:L,D-transpeptidase catalytic domain/Putative peptidoglycan binding domain
VRSRSFAAVVVVLVLLFGGAGGLLAYDGSQAHTIADGIKIGGVPVGGLSVSNAAARVRSAYAARLRRPLVVRYGRQRFVLSPRSVALAVDVESSVQQALARSRSDNLIGRVLRYLTGGRIDANIDPDLRFSSAAVSRFAGRIARVLDHPARDATISYSGTSIGSVVSRSGVSVDQPGLRARIESALMSAARGALRVPILRTEPHVSTAQLAARYPTIITVDRSSFTLRLWKHLRLVRSYRIAVGMAGLETPAGLYHIQDKEVDPSWHVPNSTWAGSLAGRTIPPGPQDPIKARWMGIFNGAGIHGTDELSSLGSAASHGCIRMAIPDVIQLYSQTPLGTPVYIA